MWELRFLLDLARKLKLQGHANVTANEEKIIKRDWTEDILLTCPASKNDPRA